MPKCNAASQVSAHSQVCNEVIHATTSCHMPTQLNGENADVDRIFAGPWK